MVLVGLSAALAVWCVKPRQHRVNSGLIAWNGILKTRSSQGYADAIRELSDRGLHEAACHSFALADILRTKYKLLWAAVWAFILGGGMTVLLLFAGVTAQQAPQSERDTSCGIRVVLRGLSIENLWNPNSAKLNYLITNRSTQDYELPDRFRVMTRTSDGILHGGDLNISVPAERFFPRGQTVEFPVWVNLGDAADHAPSEKEKAELKKQLSNTKAFFLIDEKRGCEIELPVSAE